jgi:D-3-phosphoglycerate dehydrogenase
LKKVLFLDEVHSDLEKRLSDSEFECVKAYHMSYNEVRSQLENYEGVVLRGRILMDRSLMECSRNLKFIARSGAGLENIDLKAAEEFGIKVLSAPEGNRDAVGEHAIGMLLALFNKIPSTHQEVQSGLWKREENRGTEIKGKTIGIIGFGHTGSSFAKKLSGFDCRILAHDKYKTNYAPSYVEEVSLNYLMRESDVISIHLPLSDETHYYVNDEFTSKLGKSCYLINTARGKHVEIKSLLKALDEGKILGACLDVLEFEKKDLTGLGFEDLPEDFKNLSGRSNVILSPHVAGWTVESYKRLSNVLADKILSLYATT